MGAKYTSKSASGYNSSPPSDDGSTAASNQITWAKHKTKLADPIKTLAEDINTALATAFDYSVRQITSSDNTVAGDHMRCVEIASTVTTAVTVSLADAATMTSVYRVFIKNSSSINQTLGRVTVGDTIDGAAANVTLPPGAAVVVQTNAAANGYLIVARSQAKGTATNDSAASGVVGEYVEATATSTNFPTSGDYGDLASISLTAGDWDVTAILSGSLNTAGTVSRVLAGISTTSGNSASGLTEGINFSSQIGPTSSYTSSVVVPSYRISLSATTTIYLKFRAVYADGSGPAAATGRLSARRVR